MIDGRIQSMSEQSDVIYIGCGDRGLRMLDLRDSSRRFGQRIPLQQHCVVCVDVRHQTGAEAPLPSRMGRECQQAKAQQFTAGRNTRLPLAERRVRIHTCVYIVVFVQHRRRRLELGSSNAALAHPARYVGGGRGADQRRRLP